ncbi:hypothetical protein GJAV_G00244010 [Gymnothorax javanicus]|nr:hypothetical protein GJAV_G00244010 [Gymnothorax javanicus]
MVSVWKIAVPILALGLAVVCGSMVGGYSPADLSDEGVDSVLDYAVKQYNLKSNAMYYSKAVVKSVETQVVAGINYRFKVEMVKTTCKKGDQITNIMQCSVASDTANSKSEECTFIVWVRAWLNKMELTKSICTK